MLRWQGELPMGGRNGIHRLLMAAATMVAVVLSAGCQAAVPVDVAQLPPIATTTLPADTPAPAATVTKPVVITATVPVQEAEAPVAPTETPIPPPKESEAAVAAAVADLAQLAPTA
jgi:CxxC motif-containing protein